MKNKIVLVPFPFDDLSSQKVRPALCLTDEIHSHRHIILAFITSNVSSSASETDIVIEQGDAEFAATGLKVASTVRLHRLLTISRTLILRELGELSQAHQAAVQERLRKVFGI